MRGQQMMDFFFTGGNAIDSFYDLKQEFKLFYSVLFLKNMRLLSSQDINRWTGVLWIIVMSLSDVWTLILTAPIHCSGSIDEEVMESYISPNLLWWRNKLIYILDGQRVSKCTFLQRTSIWRTLHVQEKFSILTLNYLNLSQSARIMFTVMHF